jgi:hypothetical protein
LQLLGFPVEKYDLNDLYEHFIEIADREKEVQNVHLQQMMSGLAMAAVA